MKEAILWKSADRDALCFLCAHRCRILDGERGKCGVRENRGGKLYSLVYGRLISRAIDPIEKKPLYHFLPGTESYSIATVGCNFSCDFCQNWEISQFPHFRKDIPGEEVEPEEIASDARQRGCQSISYTYTEPTVFFEFAIDTGEIAHGFGLKNVFVTNGYQTHEAIERMIGVIDAANVDLKSISDDFYRKRCGARLRPVLESIKAMHTGGIFIEITTLLIPGENDEQDEIKKLVEFIASVSTDIPWHVSRFHPDYKQVAKPPTPADKIFSAIEIGKRAGLKYVYAGNLPAGEYENTYCPKCGNLLIERHWFSSRKVGLKADRCGACNEKITIVVL
ncbi:MAG: AmmeMemoRadiSam system radical SAM enzyme [bacterium]